MPDYSLKDMLRRWAGKIGGYVPVSILAGPLKGKRWTLFPTSSYWRGFYEPDCTEEILRHLPPPGKACWDVGAHFGYFTLLMAEHTGPQQEVATFEPSSETYARLCLHLRWNKAGKVRPFHLAASDKDGWAEFLHYESPTASDNHLPYPDENADNSRCRKEKVTTVRLDTLRLSEKLQDPGLVKIDVEGHGVHVLNGMKETLKECQPVLIYSVHTEEEITGMRSILEESGYRVVKMNRREDPESATDYIGIPGHGNSGE